MNRLGFIFILFIFVISIPACGGILEHEYELEPEPLLDYIFTQDDTLTIAQWNIGHFSKGVNPNSSINGEGFERRRKDFTELINGLSSDIICLNEFIFHTIEINIIRINK